jgi:hypothetical protein
VRYFGTNIGTNTNDARFDLVPGPGGFGIDINIEDLVKPIAMAPPMFDSLRAFDGPVCAYAP